MCERTRWFDKTFRGNVLHERAQPARTKRSEDQKHTMSVLLQPLGVAEFFITGRLEHEPRLFGSYISKARGNTIVPSDLSKKQLRKRLSLTCNYLVAYNAHMNEDKVFKALADASRRELLDRLRAKSGLSLGDLCEGHAMSRQAVTKHLALLADANLVVTKKQGREKLHYLNPVPINEIYVRWIGKFEQKHLRALDNLKQALNAETKNKN